jgi:hypothetical protein
MKSIDISAAFACGTADTAKASMLNVNRIFFIIIRSLYEAFDFTAQRFIQVTIRKRHPTRACFSPARPGTRIKPQNGHKFLTNDENPNVGMPKE